MGLIDILRQEMAVKSIPSMLFSGIPTVVAYHLLDYAAFFAQVAVESIFADNEDDEDDDDLVQSGSKLKWTLSMMYVPLVLQHTLADLLGLISGFTG